MDRGGVKCELRVLHFYNFILHFTPYLYNAFLVGFANRSIYLDEIDRLKCAVRTKIRRTRRNEVLKRMKREDIFPELKHHGRLDIRI